MKTSDRIRYKINTATITEKLIAVNVLVFLFFGILNTIFSLFQIPGFSAFYDWFVLPSDPAEFILKPWTIISYSFLHGFSMFLPGKYETPGRCRISIQMNPQKEKTSQ